MTGNQKPQEPKPRNQRPASRSGGKDDSDANPQSRNRGRRAGSGSGGGRKAVYSFGDQVEHIICQCVTHVGPKGFPVNDRAELATMPPTEVARTETRILLCDRLHDGPHLWPNGDEVW